MVFYFLGNGIELRVAGLQWYVLLWWVDCRFLNFRLECLLIGRSLLPSSPFSPWIRTWPVSAHNVRGLALRNWKARSQSNELAWVRFVYLCYFSCLCALEKPFFGESGTSFSGGWALWRGPSWSNPQLGQMFSLLSFYFMEVCFVLFPFESLGSYPV